MRQTGATWITALALAVVLGGVPAHAQRLADMPRATFVRVAPEWGARQRALASRDGAAPREPIAEMAGLGLIGGVLGAVGGGYLAHELRGNCDRVDECDSTPLLLGALAGETVGMALGVHGGNGSRGSLGKTLLVSVGSGLVLAAAGLWWSDRVHDDTKQAIVGYAIPVVQLAATIQMERHGARRKAARAGR